MAILQIDRPFPERIENTLHEIGVSCFFQDMRGPRVRPARRTFVSAIFAVDDPWENAYEIVPGNAFDVLICLSIPAPREQQQYHKNTSTGRYFIHPER